MGERTQDSIQALTAEIEQLRRSNQWFKEVLDAIKEGIEVVSQDGTVIYVNAGFHRILDESKDERLGKNIYDVSPNGALVETLRTGKPSIARLHTTLNQTKTVLANAMPLVDEQGKPAGAISVFMDISDVERTGRLLEKRNLEINRLRERVQQLASSDYCFDDIIGSSDLLNQCKKVAGKIANTKMTVLLSGESGTGKELFAHSIHGASRRSRGPFIKVNCAAIPDSLLESEFFGYEAGAFSGATKAKMGKFELANGGTLFLDEIGEMNYSLQAKLLRVLQDNEVERLGGTKAIKIDVRVIAATNKNLVEEVRRGTFRKDLYYRLNEFNITLPSLDDRKEHIPLTAAHYIDNNNEEYPRDLQLTPEVCQSLMTRSWPGNIRELQNYLGKLVLFWDDDHQTSRSDSVLQSEIPPLPGTPHKVRVSQGDMPNHRIPSIQEAAETSPHSSISDLERQMILSALEKHGYDTKGKQNAAKELKISLSTLYNKLRLYKQQGEL